MDLGPFYYHAYGLVLRSDRPLPPLATQPPAPPDLVVCWGNVPEPASWEETKIWRAGIQAQVAGQGTDHLLLNWPGLGRFAAFDGRELRIDTTQTDAGLVALFALSEALGLILFQRGYFLLHGSAVAIGHEAVVFVGEPGAGKSTTAAAFVRQGVALLSDDLVCIRVDADGRGWVLPAFPQLKLWKTAVDALQLPTAGLEPVREGVDKFSWQTDLPIADKPLLLSRIYTLLPHTAQPGTLLPPKRVPVALLGHFPLADQLLLGQPLLRYFKQSAALAKTTPVIELVRPASFALLTDFVARQLAR